MNKEFDMGQIREVIDKIGKELSYNLICNEETYDRLLKYNSSFHRLNVHLVRYNGEQSMDDTRMAYLVPIQKKEIFRIKLV